MIKWIHFFTFGLFCRHTINGGEYRNGKQKIHVIKCVCGSRKEFEN